MEDFKSMSLEEKEDNLFEGATNKMEDDILPILYEEDPLPEDASNEDASNEDASDEDGGAEGYDGDNSEEGEDDTLGEFEDQGAGPVVPGSPTSRSIKRQVVISPILKKSQPDEKVTSPYKKVTFKDQLEESCEKSEGQEALDDDDSPKRVNADDLELEHEVLHVDLATSGIGHQEEPVESEEDEDQISPANVDGIGNEEGEETSLVEASSVSKKKSRKCIFGKCFLNMCCCMSVGE